MPFSLVSFQVSQTKIPRSHIRIRHTSLYEGKTRHIPISSARYPVLINFFNKAFLAKTLIPLIILLVQIQYRLRNQRSFEGHHIPILRQSSPILPPSILSHSFHLTTGIKLQNIYQFFFWTSDRHPGESLRYNQTVVLFLGSRNSHGSAWLFWKPSLIKPALICSERQFGLAHQAPSHLIFLGCRI